MKLLPIPDSGNVDPPHAEPSDFIGPVVEATRAMYQRSGFEPPWIGYLAREGDKVVGTCGFTSPPKAGEVEAAYFTFPGNEGAGVATRMARELVQLARHAGGIAAVCAHTLPEEGPSCSILRKVGFAFVGEVELPEDGRVWKWRFALADAGQAGALTA